MFIISRVVIRPKYKDFKLKDTVIIKNKKEGNYLIGKVDVIVNTRLRFYSVKIISLYNKKEDKFIKPKGIERGLYTKEDICKISIRNRGGK